MANVLHESKPSWDRWAQLIQTTPSGKTLFVCMVCGTVSPGPTVECRPKDALEGRRSLSSELKLAMPGVRTCSEVERHINERIDENRPEHLRLDIEENKLRSTRARYCDSCHGFGCQVCLGLCRRW